MAGRGPPVKKHQPYRKPKPVVRRSSAEQAQFEENWRKIITNRQRLRKTRGAGGGAMSLAERLLQKRREAGQQVRALQSWQSAGKSVVKLAVSM